MSDVNRLAGLDVKRLSAEFEGAMPGEIVRWAWETLGPRVGMSTAFGASGMVLIDIVRKEVPDLPVFTIDTGFLFRETLELKARVERRYGLKIETLHPRLSVEEQEKRFGAALYGRNPGKCCAMRKVEPMQRKLADLDGWITGLRRDQSSNRSSTRILETYQVGSARYILKVNPMAAWTRKDVWDYILLHEVPYNPLMDQGYPSLGCRPCTRKAEAGSGERSGRWAGTSKDECGIHTALAGIEEPEAPAASVNVTL